MDRKHQYVEDTLTQSERAAPFALGEPDDDPLTGPTRLAVFVDDDRFAEVDPATGYCLKVGAWGATEGGCQ